jgi:predicted short-subunit dehydrogenase-like oxidoreductase (DUF2520 family)
VAIVGAGKVGAGLFRALRAAGVRCSLRPARAGLPGAPFPERIVVLAVRDRSLGPLATELATRGLVHPEAVVLHVAGALTSVVLAPLRPVCAGVAQMHPMIAFASAAVAPSLEGGHAHVEGDPEAARRARLLCARVGLRPRTFPGLDPVAYHAAAGLVANGAAALAAAGMTLLGRAGVPAAKMPLLLGPLLRSVADNVEALGMPAALTGPVRRGDAAGVEGHLTTLRRLAPELIPLYLTMAQAQLPLARTLGEAPGPSFDALARLLGDTTI